MRMRMIEQNAGVLGVPNVELDALAHEIGRRGLAAIAVDLRPTRDARLDVLADVVVVDEHRVILVVCDGMRTRADQGHLAAQDIDQLRQLVDARLPEPTPNPRHATIVCLRLLHDCAVLGDRHGAKFEDVERHAAMPKPRLLEDRGTGRGQPNCRSDDQEKRRKEENGGRQTKRHPWRV